MYFMLLNQLLKRLNCIKTAHTFTFRNNVNTLTYRKDMLYFTSLNPDFRMWAKPYKLSIFPESIPSILGMFFQFAYKRILKLFFLLAIFSTLTPATS